MGVPAARKAMARLPRRFYRMELVAGIEALGVRASWAAVQGQQRLVVSDFLV